MTLCFSTLHAKYTFTILALQPVALHHSMLNKLQTFRTQRARRAVFPLAGVSFTPRT